MKIVVIGGSGLIGRKLVERLRRRGHDVVAASPASGVDTMTGRGLDEACAGAEVVPGGNPRMGRTHFQGWLGHG